MSDRIIRPSLREPSEEQKSSSKSSAIRDDQEGASASPPLINSKNHGPGRELDALVAEKVMGWRLVHWTCLDGSWTRNSAFPPERRGEFEASYHYAVDGWVDADSAPDVQILEAILGQRGYPIPRYSTDIAAAWEVVSQMRELDSSRFKNIQLVEYCYNRTYATFDVEAFYEYDPLTWVEANGENSTPHAICLAALKAVGA